MRSGAEPMVPLRVKLPAIALASLLSMFLAEVFSGASPLWFLSAWGILVTLPLYGGHLLLLLNLAMRFRRTSLLALYFWGILFGLYESWITKVLWAGYVGATPGLGTFLGIGVQEFSVLALFWHPVFSFVLPILVYELLVVGHGNGEAFPSHMGALTRRRRNTAIAVVIILIGAAFLNVGTKADTVNGVVTILGSIALIWVALRLAAGRRGSVQAGLFGIGSLRLGRWGMVILLLYIACLYTLTFIFILPERIPPIGTILFTFLIYAAIALLIFLVRPKDEIRGAKPGGTYSPRDLALFSLLLLVLTAIVSLSPTLDYVLFFGFYWGITGFGAVLFVAAAIALVGIRNRRK